MAQIGGEPEPRTARLVGAQPRADARLPTGARTRGRQHTLPAYSQHNVTPEYALAVAKATTAISAEDRTPSIPAQSSSTRFRNQVLLASKGL